MLLVIESKSMILVGKVPSETFIAAETYSLEHAHACKFFLTLASDISRMNIDVVELDAMEKTTYFNLIKYIIKWQFVYVFMFSKKK
jgi:hypothetical protein